MINRKSISNVMPFFIICGVVVFIGFIFRGVTYLADQREVSPGIYYSIRETVKICPGALEAAGISKNTEKITYEQFYKVEEAYRDFKRKQDLQEVLDAAKPKQ